MQSSLKARSLEWILFNRKKIIGAYIVQFQCQKNLERVHDIGQITEIYASDFMFTMKVDGNAWLLYNWDIILPEVTEDDQNIIIHDKILDIKFVILKLDRVK